MDGNQIPLPYFSRSRRISSLVIAVVALSAEIPIPEIYAQAPATPAAVSNLGFTQTPVVVAVCLDGVGESTTYESAAGQLSQYLIKKNIIPKQFFSSTSTTAPSDGSTSAHANSDLCAEVDAQNVQTEAPFVFRKISSQEAGHATCTGGESDIDACTKAIMDFVVSAGRTPAAGPRYQALSGPGVTPAIYDIWIPVLPAAPPPKSP